MGRRPNPRLPHEKTPTGSLPPLSDRVEPAFLACLKKLPPGEYALEDLREYYLNTVGTVRDRIDRPLASFGIMMKRTGMPKRMRRKNGRMMAHYTLLPEGQKPPAELPQFNRAYTVLAIVRILEELPPGWYFMSYIQALLIADQPRSRVARSPVTFAAFLKRMYLDGKWIQVDVRGGGGQRERAQIRAPLRDYNPGLTLPEPQVLHFGDGGTATV